MDVPGKQRALEGSPSGPCLGSLRLITCFTPGPRAWNIVLKGVWVLGILLCKVTFSHLLSSSGKQSRHNVCIPEPNTSSLVQWNFI